MKKDVNRALFAETADAIEKEPNAFDQWETGIWADGYTNSIHFVQLSCGTPCCVAGWFAALASSDREFLENNGSLLTAILHKREGMQNIEEDLWRQGAEAANLTVGQAAALFNEMWPPQWLDGKESPLRMWESRDKGDWFVPTPDQAVKVLRRVAKYGMTTFYMADHFYQR